MLNLPANFTDTVVIGAGPYGLSLAAHLHQGNLPFRIFGQPMQTWATQMPEGMRLKSDGFASNLASGHQSFTLGNFCKESGRAYHDTLLPVPVEDFIAYGQEFARRFVPNLETENIRNVDRVNELFRLTTASGEKFFARRVVVATGLSLFQHLPAELRRLPSTRVTHPSQHRTFQEFAGRDVTVLGRGASSLNAAVLLHEAGARVTLIARSRKLHIHQTGDPSTRSIFQRLLHPSTPLGTSLRSWFACAAPDAFHLLPAFLRRALVYKHLGPAGGSALQNRLTGFPILLGCKIHAVGTADGSGERLRLTFTDDQGEVRQHLTSHLIAGTGYRIDMNRLTMLSANLQERLRTNHRGGPKLNARFESSVPGLHFIGPIAAPEFGPLLRFVAGTQFAAGRVARALHRSFVRDQQRAEPSSGVQVLAGAAHERTS